MFNSRLTKSANWLALEFVIESFSAVFCLTANLNLPHATSVRTLQTVKTLPVETQLCGLSM